MHQKGPGKGSYELEHPDRTAARPMCELSVTLGPLGTPHILSSGRNPWHTETHRERTMRCDALACVTEEEATLDVKRLPERERA